MPKNKKRKEDSLEDVYKTTITYRCPIRGLVTEEVEIKKYKATVAPDDPSLLIFNKKDDSSELDEDADLE